MVRRVEIVDQRSGELMQIHVLQILEDESVKHLSQLADFGQKYLVFLNIFGAFEVVGRLKN